MKKVTVTIQYDDTKLSSIKYYLEKKGLDVQEELSKSLDTLFNRVVPAQVREFIAVQNGEEPAPQSKEKGRKNPKPKAEIEGE